MTVLVLTYYLIASDIHVLARCAPMKGHVVRVRLSSLLPARGQWPKHLEARIKGGVTGLMIICGNLQGVRKIILGNSIASAPERHW